jgi:hypothetical protein
VIPKSDTLDIAAFELCGAHAWGGRNGVPIEWKIETLELRVTFTQPHTQQKFFLRGLFDDYKELPPALTFCTPDWECGDDRSHFPKPQQGGRFGASIFINHRGRPVICVPFNRLAYSQNGGPHGDWGDPAQWQTAAAGQAHATTIGDMLQLIFRDLNLTNGRME